MSTELRGVILLVALLATACSTTPPTTSVTKATPPPQVSKEDATNAFEFCLLPMSDPDRVRALDAFGLQRVPPPSNSEELDEQRDFATINEVWDWSRDGRILVWLRPGSESSPSACVVSVTSDALWRPWHQKLCQLHPDIIGLGTMVATHHASFSYQEIPLGSGKVRRVSILHGASGLYRFPSAAYVSTAPTPPTPYNEEYIPCEEWIRVKEP